MKTKVEAFLEQQLADAVTGDGVKTITFRLNTELARIGRVLIETSLQSSAGTSTSYANIFSTKEHLNKAFQDLFVNQEFQDSTLNLASWLNQFNTLYDQIHDEGVDGNVEVVATLSSNARKMDLISGLGGAQSPNTWSLT